MNTYSTFRYLSYDNIGIKIENRILTNKINLSGKYFIKNFYWINKLKNL